MSAPVQDRRSVFKFLFAVLLAALVIFFREEIIDWFIHADEPAAASRAAHPAALPEAVFEPARSSLEAYEALRALLARDTTEGLSAHAEKLRKALEPAAQGGATGALVEEARRAAAELGSASGLEEARLKFGELSRALLGLAAHDARLLEGRHVFSCPMTGAGYGKWLQTDPKLENPYMGAKMLSCGAPAAVDAVRAQGEIAHYTCPMHPSVKQSGPGQCPLCGMDLTPVTVEALESGEVTLDPGQLKRNGIHSQPVRSGPLPLEVRTLGRITYDASKLTDVTLKVGGFIRSLAVDEPGQRVRKGERLFSLYSPELLASQHEYVVALESGSPGLIDAARARLRLWDLTERQLDALAKSRKPLESLPIVSPATGYVVEKNIVDGAAVMPGMQLYRIAQLNTVWVEAELYAGDLRHIKVGQEARITLPYAPGRSYRGRVVLISPSLQASTRTAQARIELKNADGALRPEMFADVSFHLERGDHLQVPASAIVYTGPRRLVFVDLGGGRLVPREVVVGARAGDRYEVISGLEEGEKVVTSGNFLVAAETRLRSLSGDVLPPQTDGGIHGGHE